MNESSPSNDQAALQPLPAGGITANVRLYLQGPMTFARATELRDAAIAAVEQQGPLVEFDLSDVTELDSAGVQILLLAKRTATAQSKELQLVGQSPAVLQTLELLRLSALFGPAAFFLFDEA